MDQIWTKWDKLGQIMVMFHIISARLRSIQSAESHLVALSIRNNETRVSLSWLLLIIQLGLEAMCVPSLRQIVVKEVYGNYKLLSLAKK